MHKHARTAQRVQHSRSVYLKEEESQPAYSLKGRASQKESKDKDVHQEDQLQPVEQFCVVIIPGDTQTHIKL